MGKGAIDSVASSGPYGSKGALASLSLLEQIETVHVSEHADSGKDLVHELGV